jgi:hypothetical protein
MRAAPTRRHAARQSRARLRTRRLGVADKLLTLLSQ